MAAEKKKPLVLPPPGRDLDALFADRVLGWQVSRESRPWTVTRPDGTTGDLPTFSGSQEAMTEGMKEMLAKGWQSSVGKKVVGGMRGVPDQTVCFASVTNQRAQCEQQGPTMPAAFVRAALFAVEAESRYVG